MSVCRSQSLARCRLWSARRGCFHFTRRRRNGGMQFSVGRGVPSIVLGWLSQSVGVTVSPNLHLDLEDAASLIVELTDRSSPWLLVLHDLLRVSFPRAAQQQYLVADLLVNLFSAGSFVALDREVLFARVFVAIVGDMVLTHLLLITYVDIEQLSVMVFVVFRVVVSGVLSIRLASLTHICSPWTAMSLCCSNSPRSPSRSSQVLGSFLAVSVSIFVRFFLT